MQLVVDTNIIISALLKSGATRDVLFHPAFSFFMPEYSLEEIEAHRAVLLERTGLSSNTFSDLLQIITGAEHVIPESAFAGNVNRACIIMGAIDVKDVPFVALALSFRNAGIWSNDKGLLKQSIVPVWKTHDLIDLIKKGMIR